VIADLDGVQIEVREFPTCRLALRGFVLDLGVQPGVAVGGQVDIGRRHRRRLRWRLMLKRVGIVVVAVLLSPGLQHDALDRVLGRRGDHAHHLGDDEQDTCDDRHGQRFVEVEEVGQPSPPVAYAVAEKAGTWSPLTPFLIHNGPDPDPPGTGQTRPPGQAASG
jgi:hypothetical protein